MTTTYKLSIYLQVSIKETKPSWSTTFGIRPWKWTFETLMERVQTLNLAHVIHFTLLTQM